MTTGIFFIQVFGFLLQTYPIAILSFVSFSQEELLFPRKKLYLCLFFGMSLISFCFAIISSQYVLPSQTDAMALVSNAYMMGFILLYTAVFFFVLRTDTLKKYWCWCFSSTTQPFFISSYPLLQGLQWQKLLRMMSSRSYTTVKIS